MTAEAMRALPERLRAVESRSKAELLEEAAAAIEVLLHTLDELQWDHDKLVSFELAESKELAAAVAELKDLDTDCLVCDHNHREAPCEGPITAVMMAARLSVRVRDARTTVSGRGMGGVRAMDRAEAIKHFEYGISHDVFSEPVTGYARMAVDALRAQQGYSPAEQPPPGRFLAKTKWGKVVLVERRDWGDRDWLVGGLYIPKDITW